MAMVAVQPSMGSRAHLDAAVTPEGVNFCVYSKFAPHPRYSSRSDPLGPREACRDLVAIKASTTMPTASRIAMLPTTRPAGAMGWKAPAMSSR